MGFFEKLERKFGRYAIRNLMMYLTVLYSIGFAISLVNIEIYYNYMSLDIPKILSGQVWRLVTWIMYAPSQSIFFSAIMLVLYYSLGSNLERVWGSFRFNIWRGIEYISAHTWQSESVNIFGICSDISWDDLLYIFCTAGQSKISGSGIFAYWNL